MLAIDHIIGLRKHVAEIRARFDHSLAAVQETRSWPSWRCLRDRGPRFWSGSSRATIDQCCGPLPAWREPELEQRP